MKIFTSLLTLLLLALPLHAARLDIASAALPIGQPADLNVGLAKEGSSISTLQFDLALPSGVVLNNARVGAAAPTKQLQLSGNRVVLFGLNQDVMDDGSVVVLNVTPSGAPRTAQANLNGIVASNPVGTAVAISTTPATLTLAQAGVGTVVLAWPASPAEYAVSEYRVYESVNGGTFSVVGNVTTPGFTKSGLLAGTTYRYYVTAVNPFGENSPSNTVVAQIPSGVAPTITITITITITP